ncbi:MAG TPA: metallophosphoesterase [Acidimicrobiales bacterium]
MALELTTVADNEAVLFDGTEVVRLGSLQPDTDYEHEGIAFRTLPRPDGPLLTVLATVNDLHFGETECGRIDGLDIGPVLRSEPGDDPYPEVMNRAAVEEISALGPAAVVAKGDLTSGGTHLEYEAFLRCYRDAFGDRLHWMLGNHDTSLEARMPVEVPLPGVTLALLDTTMVGSASGQVSADQLDWLDELGARADRPVLVFGHHHAFDPSSRRKPLAYFGINPTDSAALVDVVAHRPRLVGYFAGHTHRNRVRRFAATGRVPWAELACVKDFPGAWAEYRVFESGILQIHRRIARPKALAWSERCRSMLAGLYPQYAFGAIADRCFSL